ncbi:DNA base-flipping protein [Klebsiella sp. CVUAS 8534.2]|nr:DNA base-flipping protein [Klebsiella sp. CVUAS 8534.2]
MNFPQESIKPHNGSFSALDEHLQPYLANGDTY